MKLTEILGILGFLLALITFIITRIERRKNLSIDLYCQALEELDKDNEFHLDENDVITSERVIVIDVINVGTRTVAIDINSLAVLLNGHKIQSHHLDWIGKKNFNNPINPGQNYKFGVFLESAIKISKIENRDNGVYKIQAELYWTEIGFVQT